MSALDHEPFPRGALIAAFSLIGFSLVATTAVRLTRINAPPAPITASATAPSLSVDLRFSDEPDGSIQVRDNRTARMVATLQPGTNGFIRGVMRGLARERISRGIGQAPPFRLSQDRSGALWLQDTATGRLIDLESFGTGNRDAFLQLLHPQGAAS
jgi:putative photosynthetic complex assembly protein